MLWFPIFLGVGIGLYFNQVLEPPKPMIFRLCLGVGVYLLISFIISHPLRWFFIIISWIIIGFVVISLRSHSIAEPVLKYRYNGIIEGNVVSIDRNSSNKQRIILTDLIIGTISPPHIPRYIRVSLFKKSQTYNAKLGDRIRFVATILPPSGPVEPGGFDFKRRAWFQQLGAVGYASKKITILPSQPGNQWRYWIFKTRLNLSRAIYNTIGGDSGAFASAILTGDRSYINSDSLIALRKSNLAHLLAISGLHMGLLVGIIFALVRYSFALSGYLTLRLPTKKIAAFIALIAGAFYLIFSGMAVATIRAFIMVAIMLCAVMLERSALSLRALALAATIILLLRPENLLEPGFQMSFAATAGLIASFQTLQQSQHWQRLYKRRTYLLQMMISILISSFVAGLATAPFSAYHFNQIAHFGLIANILSLPVMSVIVMPSAIIAGIFYFIGLEFIPLWLMGKGIDWILLVSNWVAHLDGSVSQISNAGPYTLPLIALGACAMILFHYHLRFLGLVMILIGIIFWFQAPRPDILISDNGWLVGIKTEQGRHLNRDKGSSFIARSWLENDGDSRNQDTAATAFNFANVNDFQLIVGKNRIAYLWDKKTDIKRLQDLCIKNDFLIVPKWKGEKPVGCQFFGLNDFYNQGSLAFWQQKDGVKLVTARQISGVRLWNRSYNIWQKRRQ